MHKTLLGLLMATLIAASSSAAEWGHLKMRFVYDGQPPQPQKFKVAKDPEYCGQAELIDESLLVQATDRGLANVVVYLDAGGAAAPPIHHAYEQSAKHEVALDIKQCRFQPHVVCLRTSQTLLITNRDPVGHNPRIDTFANEQFSNVIMHGRSVKHTFQKPEPTPIPVSCSIHPWLFARLVIRDTPYAGTSDEHGKLLLENLPVGNWRFQVWHERCGWVKRATRGGQSEDWAKGRVSLEIKQGDNDFGEIKLALELFKSS